MNIRPATKADLETVERLKLQAPSLHTTAALNGTGLEAQLQTQLNLWRTGRRSLQTLLVATDDDRVIGAIALDTVETAVAPRLTDLPALRPLGFRRTLRFLFTWLYSYRPQSVAEAYLREVIVEPVYRQHGIAVHLTQEAERLAQRLGKTVSAVLIDRSNKPSLNLIRKLGYREVPIPWSPMDRLLGHDSHIVRFEKPL